MPPGKSPSRAVNFVSRTTRVFSKFNWSQSKSPHDPRYGSDEPAANQQSYDDHPPWICCHCRRTFRGIYPATQLCPSPVRLPLTYGKSPGVSIECPAPGSVFAPTLHNDISGTSSKITPAHCRAPLPPQMKPSKYAGELPPSRAVSARLHRNYIIWNKLIQGGVSWQCSRHRRCIGGTDENQNDQCVSRRGKTDQELNME